MLIRTLSRSRLEARKIQLRVHEYKISLNDDGVEFLGKDHNKDGYLARSKEGEILKIELEEDLYSVELGIVQDLEVNWKKEKTISTGRCYLNGLILLVKSRGSTERYDLSKQNLAIRTLGNKMTLYTRNSL